MVPLLGAGQLGRQLRAEFPEGTPFCHTPHWPTFQEDCRDKITTLPEQLALKAVAGTAFTLGRRFPEYTGLDELFADRQPGRPSCQEGYRLLGEEAESVLQRNPDAPIEEVREAVNLRLEEMWPGPRIGAQAP